MNDAPRTNIPWPVDPETAPLNPSRRTRGPMYCPMFPDPTWYTFAQMGAQIVLGAISGAAAGLAIWFLVNKLL